jgi:hypothetical protein
LVDGRISRFLRPIWIYNCWLEKGTMLAMGGNEPAAAELSVEETPMLE